MRILYGIQLTGNGHITRSAHMINALRALGASVDAVGSGGGSQLAPPILDARFEGLTFAYRADGSVDWPKTVLRARPLRIARELTDVRGYDLVVTDFEPVSAWSARLHGVPCVGFGNQYSLLSPLSPRPSHGKSRLAEAFMRHFAPCDRAVAIGYQRHDSFILPPVIDQSLLEIPAGDEGFVLAYLPSSSPEMLMGMAEKTGREWRIYSHMARPRKGRVSLLAPDRAAFRRDLAACSGVLTASGFSTTSEALVLGKRLWSSPMPGQYEQLCNARSLELIGARTGRPTAEGLSEWLAAPAAKYEWQDPTAEAAAKITATEWRR